MKVASVDAFLISDGSSFQSYGKMDIYYSSLIDYCIIPVLHKYMYAMGSHTGILAIAVCVPVRETRLL